MWVLGIKSLIFKEYEYLQRYSLSEEINKWGTVTSDIFLFDSRTKKLQDDKVV